MRVAIPFNTGHLKIMAPHPLEIISAGLLHRMKPYSFHET